MCVCVYIYMYIYTGQARRLAGASAGSRTTATCAIQGYLAYKKPPPPMNLQ